MIDIKDLTLREKICQTVILRHHERYFKEYGSYKKFLKEYPIGGIFVGGAIVGGAMKSAGNVFNVYEKVNKEIRVPVIFCCDFENGQDEPHAMAIGAANDKKLAYESGVERARIMKYYGNHWMFNPVADLALSWGSYVNIRSLGDNAKKVSELLIEMVRGANSENIVSTAKHFPGHGMEYLDPHTTRIEVDFTKEEWDSTYRHIYKSLIDNGLMTIMSGHIALPCYQSETDEYGAYPIATFSKELITDLLKKDLGFKGVVITDALQMGGCCGKNNAQLALDAFLAGHDMLLWPDISYVDLLEEKILNGEVPMERLDDSVERILKMKEFAKCGRREKNIKPVFPEVSRRIAEKSVTMVNNYKNLIPLDSRNIKKILLQIVSRDNSFYEDLKYLKILFEERGIDVIMEEKIWTPRLEELEKQVDLTIFALYEGPGCSSGPVFITGAGPTETIWASQAADKDKTVIASFGSPFVYNEYYRYFPTYINMYSPVISSCEAFVRALFGEIECSGISPVKL